MGSRAPLRKGPQRQSRSVELSLKAQPKRRRSLSRHSLSLALCRRSLGGVVFVSEVAARTLERARPAPNARPGTRRTRARRRPAPGRPTSPASAPSAAPVVMAAPP
eukprot:4121289-Prymnesium_polylepis.2